MAFTLLLDEMTEASLAEYCRNLGHDVERVVDAPELGPGSDDAAIVRYAEREHRVLFQPDDRRPSFETANVIDAVAAHVDQWQVVSHEERFT